MTDARNDIKREYNNRAIRAERIMAAFETILGNRSLSSEDGKTALETITGSREEEIEDVIKLWVLDESSAKIISKLAFLALMSVKARLKDLEEREAKAVSHPYQPIIIGEEED